MLSEGDALQLAEQGLVPRCGSDRDAFEGLTCKHTVRPLVAAEGQWMRLHRTSGRLPFALFVGPLVVDEPTPFAAPPAAVVVVHDLAARVTIDPRELKQLYGLTDAEARVACALANGHDVESASASIGISTGTIRSHLKTVFRKMNVNRQQDLIRVLTSLGNGL